MNLCKYRPNDDFKIFCIYFEGKIASNIDKWA